MVQTLSQIGGKERTNTEWLELNERMLDRIQKTREASDCEFLLELLSRLPDRHSPLAYCTDMTTALLLNLNQPRSKVTSDTQNEESRPRFSEFVQKVSRYISHPEAFYAIVLFLCTDILHPRCDRWYVYSQTQRVTFLRISSSNTVLRSYH